MEYHLTPVDYSDISSGEETVTANNWLSEKSFNFCSHASSTWWPVVLSDMNKCAPGIEAAGMCCCGKCFAQWVAAARAGQVQSSGFCGRDIGLVQPWVFAHNHNCLCFRSCLCLWGTGFAYTLWAPRLPHKHEESSSCHDYRVCFRLNIMLFSYDNICFCIALLLFVKISEDLQDLNNF